MEDKVVVGGYPGLLEGAYVQLAARRVESGLAGSVTGDEGPGVVGWPSTSIQNPQRCWEVKSDFHNCTLDHAHPPPGVHHCRPQRSQSWTMLTSPDYTVFPAAQEERETSSSPPKPAHTESHMEALGHLLLPRNIFQGVAIWPKEDASIES